MPQIAFVRTQYISTLSPTVTMPLGILQLDAVLRRHDFPAADILDMQVHHPEDIRARLERVIERAPDFIGLSALSQYLPLVRQVSAFFKKRLPNTSIILGGPLISFNPDHLSELPDVDYGLAGEGEESLPLLLKALSSGGDGRDIPGLVMRAPEGVLRNPVQIPSVVLDDLPPIDWSRVDFQHYAKFLSMALRRSRYCAVMTSRGCPFQCIFCHKMFGNRFRARSPENVLEEMHRLYRDHGIRRFEITDDIFNWDYDRATQILVRIRDELPGARINFCNGLRVEKIDEPFVKLLAEARCELLALCVESAEPRIQKLIRKNLDLGAVENAVRWTRKYGVYTWGVFMIGFPTETAEEMNRTIDYAHRMDVDFLAIHVANPYEGTVLREMTDGAAASRELGHMHGNFAGRDVPMEAINNRKLKVMRARMIRPSNWYFAWSLMAWQLWWLGPRQVMRHLLDILKDYFTRRKNFTVDAQVRERDDIASRTMRHLE